MKRIAVLILALALMLTGSALAVYDPAASTPTMWDGEVTTITFTSRLPNIVLENNPVLKRVEEAVGVQLVIPVHQIHEAFLRGDDLVDHGLGQNAEALADVLIQKSAALVAQVGDVQTPRVVHAVSVGVFLGDAHGVLIQIVGRYRNVHAKLLEPVAAIRNGQRRQLLHARQAVQLVAQRAHAAVLEIGLVEPREGVGQLVLQLLQIPQ